MQPSDASIHASLGGIYSKQTLPDYESTVAEYRRALTVNPWHEVTLKNVATVAIQMKKVLITSDAINQLAKMNPLI